MLPGAQLGQADPGQAQHGVFGCGQQNESQPSNALSVIVIGPVAFVLSTSQHSQVAAAEAYSGAAAASQLSLA